MNEKSWRKNSCPLLKGTLKSIAIKWSWKSAHAPEGFEPLIDYFDATYVSGSDPTYVSGSDPTYVSGSNPDGVIHPMKMCRKSTIISSQTLERSQCNPLWRIQNKQNVWILE